MKLNAGPLTVEFADGTTQCYDRVVATIASPLLAELAPQMADAEQQAHRDIRYLGVVCGSMLTRKPISPYYVTNITDPRFTGDDAPLTAVIELTTIVDPADLGGNHLIYLPKYAADNHDSLTIGDDEFRERCLATLESMYDHFDRSDVVDFRVARAKYVAALSTIDYSQNLPEVVTSVPGLYPPPHSTVPRFWREI